MFKFSVENKGGIVLSWHASLHSAVCAAFKHGNCEGIFDFHATFTSDTKAVIKHDGVILYTIQPPHIRKPVGKLPETRRIIKFSGRPNDTGWFNCTEKSDNLNIEVLSDYVKSSLGAPGTFVLYIDKFGDRLECRALSDLDTELRPFRLAHPRELFLGVVQDWCKCNADAGSMQLRTGAQPSNTHAILVGVFANDGCVTFAAKSMLNAGITRRATHDTKSFKEQNKIRWPSLEELGHYSVKKPRKTLK